MGIQIFCDKIRLFIYLNWRNVLKSLSEVPVNKEMNSEAGSLDRKSEVIEDRSLLYC